MFAYCFMFVKQKPITSKQPEKIRKNAVFKGEELIVIKELTKIYYATKNLFFQTFLP